MKEDRLQSHQVHPTISLYTCANIICIKLLLTYLLLCSQLHAQLPAPRYGTTCRLTSQLHRHSRSSDSAFRHFCFRAHILTLSVNLQTMYFFLHLRGPSNNLALFRPL